MPPIVTPLSAANPSPSWRDVIIVESVVASFVAPALRTQPPFSTRRRFRLCTPRVVRLSLLMRPPPRLFLLHACAMRATPKSTVLPPVTRLHHRPRHVRRDLHLHPLLLGPLPRAAHVLSHRYRRLRILRSPMTCGTTLFGSGPIFARPPEGEGGRLSHRPFLIT